MHVSEIFSLEPTHFSVLFEVPVIVIWVGKGEESFWSHQISAVSGTSKTVYT